jgi:hypothetical protein
MNARIMDEAGLWSSRLRGPLQAACEKRAWRKHFVRVENRIGDGDPDVYYRIGGVAGHIELKYTPTHPTLALNQVLTKGKGMRRSQIIWASREIWVGGMVWLIVGTPRMTWAFDLRRHDAPSMDAFATRELHEYDALADWRSDQGDWDQLITLLRGRI